MGKILCIETATTNCSVAVGENGKLLALREENNKQYSHAEKLHLFIAEVMKEATLELSDLDAIAVSMGPGSYTGLRIGVSSAKGLCFSLDLPLIAIPTLAALAKQAVVPENGLVVPMLDARRMEVYSAVFKANGEQIRDTQAEILTPLSFQGYLESHPVYFIGDGVEKCQKIIEHPNAHFINNSLPSAREMIPLATEKWKEEATEDVAYFEPFYLKDFVGGKKKTTGNNR